MLIFTLKAKRLIGDAISNFGDDSHLAVWRKWTADHPEVRRGPKDPWDDATGPMPGYIREVALTSLRRRLDALMRRVETEKLSEDEIADLTNDVAETRSIARFIENPPVP
jgi:hypothetical protein